MPVTCQNVPCPMVVVRVPVAPGDATEATARSDPLTRYENFQAWIALEPLGTGATIESRTALAHVNRYGFLIGTTFPVESTVNLGPKALSRSGAESRGAFVPFPAMIVALSFPVGIIADPFGIGGAPGPVAAAAGAVESPFDDAAAAAGDADPAEAEASGRAPPPHAAIMTATQAVEARHRKTRTIAAVIAESA